MSSSAVIFALAGGSFIFLGVIIALFFAIVFGYYTYRGSGINAHSSDGLDGAPGSDEPSQASGRGRVHEANPDEVSAGGGFSSHGTGTTSAEDRRDKVEAEGPSSSRSAAHPKQFE